MHTAIEHVFLARQAIFDRKKRVVGYELLFRAPGTPDDDAGSADASGAALISEAVLAFGRELVAEGGPDTHLLVHCWAGVSRSTAVRPAWVMTLV